MSKKRIDICGTLPFPLYIGYSTFIQVEGDNGYVTSPVVRFLTMPSGVIYIETKNSHYYVHPPAKAAAEKGVRV